MNRRQFLGALAGAAGTAAGAGALATVGPKPRPLLESAAEGRRRNRFPNVVLLTQEGKQVQFYDDLLKDKTVLINFLFTSCEDDCPLQTANLARVQRILGSRVGRDVFMYSITLDPEHDTPEVLRDYARNFGVGPGWLFLTGELEDTETLRRTFGLVDPDPVVDADKEQHIGMCWLGIEPLERWSACPTMTRSVVIARYLSWAEPNGERPNGVV